MSKKPEDFVCSASTINLFLRDPCLFILKYYFGMRSDFGIHAQRGKAIEHGVDRFFETGDMEQSKQDALDEFLSLSFGLDEDIEDVEELIPEWTENAIASIIVESEGKTPIMQRELNFEVDGMKFIGFLDYEFDNFNIDLKTSTVSAMPHILIQGPRRGKLKAGKEGHVRQQVLYNHATNHHNKLLYVSPEESLLYTIQDDENMEYMEEIRSVVKEIKKLLTSGLEYGINKYTPNEKLFRGFYYNDEMVHKVKELWED